MSFSKTLCLLALLSCIVDAASVSSRVEFRPPEREHISAFEGLKGGDEDNANFQDAVTEEDSKDYIENELGSVATERVEQLHRAQGLLQETDINAKRQVLTEYELNRGKGSTEVRRASTKTLLQNVLGEHNNNDRFENQDQPTPTTISSPMRDLSGSVFDDDQSEGDTSRSRRDGSGAPLRGSLARQARNSNGSRQQVQCRCEYPDENVYQESEGGGSPSSPTSSSVLDSLDIFQNRPKNDSNDATQPFDIHNVFNWRRLGQVKKKETKFEGSRKLTARSSIDVSNLYVVNGEYILSQNCWACQGVQHRCPGQTIDCPLWHMQCSLPVNAGNGERRGPSYGMGKGKGKRGGGSNYYGKGMGKSGKKGGKSGKKHRGLFSEDDSSVDEDSSERVSMRSALAPRNLRRISDHFASDRDARMFNHRDPNDQVRDAFTLPNNLGDTLNGVKTPNRENDPGDSTNIRVSAPRNPSGQGTFDLVLSTIKAPNRSDDLIKDLHEGGSGSCNGNSCGGNVDSCRVVMLPASHPRCNLPPGPPGPLPSGPPGPLPPGPPGPPPPTLSARPSVAPSTLPSRPPTPSQCPDSCTCLDLPEPTPKPTPEPSSPTP